jgi:hypothetical protein
MGIFRAGWPAGKAARICGAFAELAAVGRTETVGRRPHWSDANRTFAVAPRRPVFDPCRHCTSFSVRRESPDQATVGPDCKLHDDRILRFVQVCIHFRAD